MLIQGCHNICTIFTFTATKYNQSIAQKERKIRDSVSIESIIYRVKQERKQKVTELSQLHVQHCIFLQRWIRNFTSAKEVPRQKGTSTLHGCFYLPSPILPASPLVSSSKRSTASLLTEKSNSSALTRQQNRPSKSPMARLHKSSI